MSPSWLFLSKGESGSPLEHMCDVQLMHRRCQYLFWCNVQLKPLQPVNTLRQLHICSSREKSQHGIQICSPDTSGIIQLEIIADPDISFGTAYAHELTPRHIKVAEIWQPRWGGIPWQSRANFALFAATAFVGRFRTHRWQFFPPHCAVIVWVFHSSLGKEDL